VIKHRRVPLQNVTFNGYHLPTLAKLARELGSPTNNGFAEFLWRLHNSNALPVELSTSLMEEAGYEAFKGFPLQRKAVK
jgi:hypothetical protein